MSHSCALWTSRGTRNEVRIVANLGGGSENVHCSQTQRGQLVDRRWGGGIIPSRSVIKPGGFYAEVCGFKHEDV